MPWPGCVQSHPLVCRDTTGKAQATAAGSHAAGAPVSPVEQHVGLHVLYYRLMDLGDVLVIKFVPLPIDHILAVGNVVPT